jgi:phosphate transport system substrate-binding protein
MRAIHKIAVAGAAVVAFVGIGMSTARADAPYTPPLTDLVGVGSDTITPLWAGSPSENFAGSLSYDYNLSITAPPKVWSMDAVNPVTGASGDTVTTKAANSTDTSCQMARPNGSSAGIAAMNLNQLSSDGTDFCIDFARSSRAPNTTTFNDAFAPLAHDAIAWTKPLPAGETNPQPSTLTLAQLRSIYSCTVTNWNQVGGANAPIVPVMPQAGSGTRATWTTIMGVATNPGCWIDGTDPLMSSAPVIEENTGGSPGNHDLFTHTGTFDWPLGQTTTTAVSADIIFPYSIGDWVAQANPTTGTGTGVNGATVGGHSSSIWFHGVMHLGNTGGVVPTNKNSFGQLQINPFFPSQFGRTLYDVVRNGTANPTGPTTVSFPTTPANEANMQSIFGPTGFLCTSTTAQSDIISYGFGLLGSGCGVLTAGD